MIHIDNTAFGSITVDGEVYEHDILIRLNGQIKKRKKKLSKAVYGTSHQISRDEAKHIYEKGAKKLIIGSGQYDRLSLSKEADSYLKDHQCKVVLLPTPEAIDEWNRSQKSAIGLFHITC
jgi:hypothetical protein